MDWMPREREKHIDEFKYYVVEVAGHKYHISNKEGAGYVY